MKLTGYDNLLAAVAPTANSTAIGYPVTAVQNRQLWDRTRTEDGTFTLILTYDMGSSKTFPYVAGFGHNLLDDAEIQVEISDDSDFSTGYDSTAVAAFDLSRPRPVDLRPPWGWPILHVPSSPQSGRYLRVTLDDVSRASGHVELAHLVAGPVIDLFVRRLPVRGSDASEGAAELRDWMLTVRVDQEDADELAILHAWSRTRKGRFLLIPDSTDPESWQYDVIWCIASEDRFEIQRGGSAYPKTDVRLGLSEVSF